MGRKVKQGLWEDMMKGNWSDELTHIWCSSPTGIVLKAIVPEGSDVGEKLKNAEANGLLHPGSECCSKSSYRIVEEDKEFFEDIKKEIAEYSIEETRDDLDYGSSGSSGNSGNNDSKNGDGGEDGTDGDKKNPTSSNNDKNDNNGNSTTTIVEDGSDSTLWIILGVVDGVFLLLIIGVVVFAVIFLNKKPAKKEETLEELEARLAAMKEAFAEEAPVEETPTEDAE